LIIVGIMIGFGIASRFSQPDSTATASTAGSQASLTLDTSPSTLDSDLLSLESGLAPLEADAQVELEANDANAVALDISGSALSPSESDSEPGAKVGRESTNIGIASSADSSLPAVGLGPPGLVHTSVLAAQTAQEANPDVAADVPASKPQLVARYAPDDSMAIERLPIHQGDAGIGSGSTIEDLKIVTRGEIGSGESLGSSLRRQGISAGAVHVISTEMRGIFDFRHSRPGDTYRLAQDLDGRVLDFRYTQNPEESHSLSWDGMRYTARKETAELRSQIAKIAGVVDSSFYGAVLALGEQSALATEFSQILAWNIDFSRSVHPGDEFQILYERLYRRNDDGEDEYVRPGRILAGHYEGRAGEHTVVYFEDDKGAGAYFRPDGTSVERAFLAAPLEFGRISSRFTRSRRHPILNVTRPHPGIDYAAPHGTPVWSVAAGVIEYKARAGASGNLIRVRHEGGMTSHYAHLANFAKGLKVGDRVEQKQVIGYVGSTGLSTGPHVCFRVKQDGRYVDPMKISGPAGDPIDSERLAVFRSIRDQRLADLGPGPLSLADEAL
jgi:murein DD-endopeptidase MepM/ murein hydrolase activator NlpD